MNKFCLFIIIWVLFARGAAASDWPVFGHDPARSADAGDQGLSPTNVGTLRERWRLKLGDVADSSPIVVGDNIFITSKRGTTYAVAAKTGRVVWRFATRGPNITTATPAYDSSGKALYVGGVDGFIHRLDVNSGRETRAGGFPAQITTAPRTEKDASSLNIANGYLYAQTSGYYGDATPYVGHVVAIHLSDGKKNVFNTLCASIHKLVEPQSCGQQRSGMWSRSGVVVDPDPSMGGRIYVATGNGPFNPGEGSYGDSALSLSADAAQLLGYYTPPNYAELEQSDEDLGSSSPVMLPRVDQSKTPLIALQGGKDRLLRLLDRGKLGSRLIQTVQLQSKLFSAPAVWKDAQGTLWIFIGLTTGIQSYRLVTENRNSRLETGWHAEVTSDEGTSPIVTNGVIFVAADSELVALDAENGRRLWKHTIGAIHWESPAVANGAVYCADEDGFLTAFSK